MSETQDEKVVDNTEKDQTLLLVTGSKGKDSDREYVKKLSNAILQVYQKHNIVRLRCVGAASLNNAEKAYIIARVEAEKKGLELVCKSHFVTVSFDGVEKTGILKEIIAMSSGGTA